MNPQLFVNPGDCEGFMLFFFGGTIAKSHQFLLVRSPFFSMAWGFLCDTF